MSLEFLLFQSTQETEFIILTNVGLGSTMRHSEKCSLVTGRQDLNCLSTAAVKAKHDAHVPARPPLPGAEQTLNKYLLSGPANEGRTNSLQLGVIALSSKFPVFDLYLLFF